MIEEADLRRALSSAPNQATRIQYFGAILAREAETSEVIIVGGSAIEIHTRGGYASGDIDIVGPVKKLSRVLSGWGFEKKGRLWIHEPLRMVVDIPSDEYHGSLERTTLIVTPFGQVRIAGPEDLVVSRLISAKYWQIPGDFNHALLLASEVQSGLDWDYIQTRARREHVEDLLIELRNRIRRLS